METMDISNRIKLIRKELGLSRVDFGAKIGLSGDSVYNIEAGRLARPEQKLSIYKLICNTYSINEEWLMNGTNSMFKDENSLNLEDLAKKYNLSDMEISIIKNYIQLPKNIRQSIMSVFQNNDVNSLPISEFKNKLDDACNKKK